MFAVYEVSEGKRDLWRYESEDRFNCEVWVDHHSYEHPTKARKFEIREV